jgi:predicted secreted protein
MSRHARIVVPALLGALALAASAWASAPPVGPLPPGPTKHIVLKPGATVVLSLPKLADPGLVWRIARPYDASVAAEQSEGETRYTVWLRFKAAHAGSTSIRFGLTRGETRTALFSETFRIDVR